MTGFDQSDHDRLQKLEARIDAAQKADAEKPGAGLPVSDRKAMAAGRVGFELMGIVLAGVGLGWLLDSQTGAAPWGALAGLFTGFIAGIAHVWRSMQETAQKGE